MRAVILITLGAFIGWNTVMPDIAKWMQDRLRHTIEELADPGSSAPALPSETTTPLYDASLSSTAKKSTVRYSNEKHDLSEDAR